MLRRMFRSALVRIALAGAILVMLLGGAVAADAYARGQARRTVRSPVAQRSVAVALGPQIGPRPKHTLRILRVGAVMRLLLGCALMGGVFVHLARSGGRHPSSADATAPTRLHAGASAAAVLAAAWAFASAFDLGTRAADAGLIRVTLGAQRGAFALHDVYLMLALLVGAVCGLRAGMRGAEKSPTGGRP